MKKKGKIIIAITGIIIVAAIVGFLAYNNNSEVRVREQLALGQKYLEEMNYEQAVVAFELAIEIDPMSVEAYLGLVEVYIRTGDFEIALEYAKKGYELTKDERLKEKIDMIESGNIFAENGWKMKESYYEGDGSLNGYITYTYRLDGKIETMTAYHGDGSLSGKIEYQYDDEGRCLVGCHSWSYGDGRIDICKGVYEYDTEGEVIQVNVYDDNGNLDYYEQYEYDSEGKRITCKTYYDSVLSEYEEYQYDTKGREVRRDWYDVDADSDSGEDEENHFYQETEYNAKGNRIRVKQYFGNRTLTNCWEYEYDSEGKEIGCKTYDADGTLTDYWKSE